MNNSIRLLAKYTSKLSNNNSTLVIATSALNEFMPCRYISRTKQNTNTKQETNRIKLVDYLDTTKNKQLDNAQPLMDHVTNKEIKFYDPPYLAREAPFPNYDVININLKGYDYTTLDCIFRHVEKMCQSLKLNVIDTYAMPARSFKIKTYQPFSTNLDKEYELNTYHRVIRIKDLKSTFAPLLFESIQLNLPEGVQMSISVPTVEEEEFRYVPDIELNELRQRLTEIEGPPKYDPAEANSSTPAKPTVKK
jgi:large subunit ribosomal protein L48